MLCNKCLKPIESDHVLGWEVTDPNGFYHFDCENPTRSPLTGEERVKIVIQSNDPKINN